MDNFDFPKDAVFLGLPVIEAVFWSATKLQSLHATGVCTQNIKSGMVRKLDIELAPKTNKFDPKPTFTCDDPFGNTNTGQ